MLPIIAGQLQLTLVTTRTPGLTILTCNKMADMNTLVNNSHTVPGASPQAVPRSTYTPLGPLVPWLVGSSESQCVALEIYAANRSHAPMLRPGKTDSATWSVGLHVADSTVYEGGACSYEAPACACWQAPGVIPLLGTHIKPERQQQQQDGDHRCCVMREVPRQITRSPVRPVSYHICHTPRQRTARFHCCTAIRSDQSKSGSPSGQRTV